MAAFLQVFILAMVFYSCQSTKYVPENKYLLTKNEIVCDNSAIDKYELESYVKQTPNRKILGVIKFHLGVYNMISPEKLAKRIDKRHKRKEAKVERKNKKRVLKNKPPKNIRDNKGFSEWLQGIGEPPVVYDEYLKDKSVKQIKQFLKNKGYYYSIVTDTVIFKKRKCSIRYNIITKTPYFIDSINYLVEDKNIEKIVLSDTINSEITKGEIFEMDNLTAERDRITSKMKENGYYSFLKEYIYYKADTTLPGNNVNITIGIKNVPDELGKVSPHKQYLVREVYFFTDWDPKLALEEKEDYYKRFDTVEYKGYYFVYENKLEINPDVIVNCNYIKRGVLYNEKKVEDSYTQLGLLRNFKLINIRFEQFVIEKSTNNYLKCIIQLTPLVKQSYSVEVEGTNSSGNMGIAGNLSYQHKSLFKNAEIFSVGLRGGLEVQSVIDENSDPNLPSYLPFNTVEMGADAGLDFPKFMIPFFSNRFEKFIRLYKPRTLMSIGYDFQQRPDYTRIISNISFGYKWKYKKKSEYDLYHVFNPFEINAVSISNLSDEFQARIKDTYLEKSYDSLFISAINYSIVYTDQAERKKLKFLYFRGKAETAGNILYTFDEIRKSPKTDGVYTIFGNKFAQYFKTDLELKYNYSTNSNYSLVYRVFTGFAIPYGNMDAIPFVKQYFGGGANGMRSWQVYKLGPGSYINSVVRPFQTADFKLEGNMEYRFNLLWVINGAIFVDAGNIWSLSKIDDRKGALFSADKFLSEIAIGTGFGLRFDFSFFIFRTDLGLKVKNPIEDPGERWIFFSDGIKRRNMVLNFAIGYPF